MRTRETRGQRDEYRGLFEAGDGRVWRLVLSRSSGNGRLRSGGVDVPIRDGQIEGGVQLDITTAMWLTVAIYAATGQPRPVPPLGPGEEFLAGMIQRVVRPAKN